ncbi:MAG: hypothetical protein IPM96_13950 [Ignavibacteria bacterium]|nr:hypothetical protein [Ignavibacteria bacterium]
MSHGIFAQYKYSKQLNGILSLTANSTVSIRKVLTEQFRTAAIFQIVTILTGNVVSFIFGIIILTNLSKEENRNFLKEKDIF